MVLWFWNAGGWVLEDAKVRQVARRKYNTYNSGA